MEHVAPVEGGRLRRRIYWLDTVLALIVIGVLVVGSGDVLRWALNASFANLLLLVVAVGLFLLPGLALVRLFWSAPLPLVERLTLAVGVSVALPSILLLISDVIGLRWNAVTGWVYLGVSALVCAWPFRGRLETGRLGDRETGRSGDKEIGGLHILAHPLTRLPAHPLIPTILLFAITLLALAVRVYVARDLPVGMWGDSYHHTMIAQLLIENGGLFSSWQPYVPLRTFTYHFGFHSHVALLSLLTGEPATRGVIIVGQILNALAAPMAYLLTSRLFGNRAAGLWAALIVGFLNPMPAYYVNWGRYTQLAGQIILPAVCVAWMTLFDSAVTRSIHRPSLLRLLVFTVLLTSGLALTHYRVAVFAACFVLVYGLYVLIRRPTTDEGRPTDEGRRTKDEGQMEDGRRTTYDGRQLTTDDGRRTTTSGSPFHPFTLSPFHPFTPSPLHRFVSLAAVGLAAGALILLLTAPWLLRLREGALLKIGSQFLANNVGAEQTNIIPPLESILTLHIRPYLVVAALIGIIALCVRRQWQGLTLVAWAIVVWVAANPYLIGLTGAGILTNNAVIMAAYLIVSPLAGLGIAAVFSWGGARGQGLGVKGQGSGDRERGSGGAGERGRPGDGQWTTDDGQSPISDPSAPLRTSLQSPISSALQLILGVALIIWGMGPQQTIITPAAMLVTSADAAAMEWIMRETPTDAKIAVNSFPAYGNSLYAGSDGGWWIPLLTGRKTNLPPIVYGSEAGEQPTYYRDVNNENAALNTTIAPDNLRTQEAAEALRAAGYAYLYDGPATSNQPELIQAATVGDSPLYELVYERDGVRIWKVR
jgi:hypothetical protein